jgi:predicted Fe-S protein YdhL (DUF1289 family)
MKLRFQFGNVMGIFLATGLLCSPIHAQRNNAAAQQEGAPPLRRAQRPLLRPRLQNALPPVGNPNKLPPKAIERLQDMPPRRQEQFLENNQRFRNLPPDQQAQIRQRLQAWNRLTPDQQQALRDRQNVWEQMTPEQQRNVRQSLLPRWQQMAPARRQAILGRLHSLRNMSESDRQAKLNDPAFVQGLSTDEREMLGQLAHLHVGMAPDPPGM